MSKGFGRLQSFWIQIAANKESTKNPWTFDEVCRSALDCDPVQMRPALKRSRRRALKGMVDDNHIICLGTRGSCHGHHGYFPARYVLNPVLLDNKDPRRKDLVAHLAKCGIEVQGGDLV